MDDARRQASYAGLAPQDWTEGKLKKIDKYTDTLDGFHKVSFNAGYHGSGTFTVGGTAFPSGTEFKMHWDKDKQTFVFEGRPYL